MAFKKIFSLFLLMIPVIVFNLLWSLFQIAFSVSVFHLEDFFKCPGTLGWPLRLEEGTKPDRDLLTVGFSEGRSGWAIVFRNSSNIFFR